MKQEEREPPKVGDVVIVEGFHRNYRPTVREIDGEVAVVSSAFGHPLRIRLSKLLPAPPVTHHRGK